MMALDQPQHRRHSLTNEDAGSARSHPGRIDVDSTQFSPRRVRLPRSKSTSNMLDGTNLPLRVTADQLRDVAREQIDKDNLRALAEFFRTTEPPCDTLPSPDQPDECFALPASKSKVARKFSGSLRHGKRARWPNPPMQTQLPRNTISETTAAGHRHIAITIPAPYDKHGHGFTSQGPVSAPGDSMGTVAGPKEWPRRGSSKGALSNATEDRRRASSVSPLPSFTRGVRHERSMTSLSSARPATAKSTTTLNPVEEGHETCQDQHAGIVTPLTAPSRQLYRSASASFDQNSFALRQPATEFSFPTTNVTSEVHDSGSSAKTLHHRRQMSRMSKKSKESRDLSLPNSPASSARSSPKQLPDLIVKPNLGVPLTSTAAESPGYHNMLSKMSFPSPPATSRPSSPANSVSSISLNQPSLASPFTPPVPSPTPTPPVIRPRTTSKRACVTTQFSPTSSLNEIVMRHAQTTPRPIGPGDTPGTADSSKGSIGTSFTTSTRPNTSQSTEQFGSRVERSQDERIRDDETVADFPHDKRPTVIVNSRYPAEIDAAEETKIQRQSASSHTTGITDTYSHLTTASSSFRSSARSDITTSTFTTAKDEGWGQEAPSNREPANRLSTASSIGMLPIMGVTKSGVSDSPTLGQGSFMADRLGLGIETNVPPSKRRDSLPRPSSAASFASLDDEDHDPTRMAERRIARKVKVREYKERDIGAVRLGLRASVVKLGESSMDSPVLGWFNPETPRARALNPSPLTQTAPWSSLNPFAGARNSQLFTNSDQRLIPPPTEETNDTNDTGAIEAKPQWDGWTLSPMMISAAIQGEEPEPSPRPVRNELVISPLIETASIDPYIKPEPIVTFQPEQEAEQEPKSRHPTQHLSTLLLLEGGSVSSTPSSRTSLSLRPKLKGRPQSRAKPRPVTMSRNPITGAIERTVTPRKSATSDYRLSRPTPPKLSDDSLRRWSHPVRAISPSEPPSTLWDRPPSSPVVEEPEEEDYAERSSEDEKEDKPRIESFRERLQREKEQKDREIESIVARTVVPTTPGPRYDEGETSSSTPEPPVAENGVGEVERRLKRLEKNGDAWLRVMGPLLENMTKTLEAMHGDGIRSELTMSDFMIDMEAEARRFSLMGREVPAILQAAAVQQNSSLGSLKHGSKSHQHLRGASTSSSLNSGNKEKKIGRGRSSSSLARLRLGLDRAAKKSIDLTSRYTEHNGPQSNAKSGSSTTPRTPQTPMAGDERASPPLSPQQGHEYEVDMAIRQRMKKQEEEFNELMSKWNSSSTPRLSSTSRRPPSSKSSTGSASGHSNGSGGVTDNDNESNDDHSNDHSNDNDNDNDDETPRTEVSPLELPQSMLGDNSDHDNNDNNNEDIQVETPVHPMLQELREINRRHWPDAPSLDMLNQPAVAAEGKSMSNTDIESGGGDGTDASGMGDALMRDLRSAASPLEC